MSVVMSTEEAFQRLDEAENVIETSNTMLLDMIRTQKRNNGLRRLAIRDEQEMDDEFYEAVISFLYGTMLMLAFAVIFVFVKY